MGLNKAQVYGLVLSGFYKFSNILVVNIIFNGECYACTTVVA